MKIRFAPLYLFLLVYSNGLIAQTQINQQDSLALAALYNATNGDQWIDNSNWLTDKPVGDWYGVFVNADGRVTNIILDNNSLNGSIPPEIGNLSELLGLSLRSNYLIGSIPPEIGNLTKLTTLNLNGNYIGGNIPVEIGNLTNLQTLALGSNLLSGQVPPEIWNLTNLVHLSFYNNQISGQIPSEIGNLSQLKDLILSNNLFEGDFPPELLLLSNLEYISISSNKFTSFPDVSSFINLTDLYINDNALTFDDILPLVDFIEYLFPYSDQQKTDQVEYHTLADGDSLVLTTSVKNSGNIYKWYKSGNYSSIGNDTTFKINSFSAAQAGTYYCIIENPLAVFRGREVPLQTKNIYVSSLPFYATQFTVTGEEGPLRFATITINGSSYETDENGIATVELTDGSYDYTLSAYGMQDSNGTVVVNAAAQNVEIAMQPELYTLNLQITDGTKVVPNALVNIDGTDYTASESGSLSISLLMGNHSYNVSATHFVGDSGTFFQVIPTLDKQIVLTPYHQVEFTVSDGINAFQNATVTINDETKMTNAEGKAEFWLLDGSYNYVITAATLGNEGGQVIVNGSAESVQSTLSAGYEITFTVSVNNTPVSGASIEIDGYTYPCNENGEKSILLSNGTYTYNVLVGSAINKTGEVVVNSAVQTLNNDIPVFAIVEAKKTATFASRRPQTYYDTDNDGILELLKGTYANSSELYMSRYIDFQESQESEVLFSCWNGYENIEILNVNNDDKPDFHIFYNLTSHHFVSKPDGSYKRIMLNTDKHPDIDVNSDGMPDWIEKDGQQLAFGQQDHNHNYINKSFTLKQLDDYGNTYDYSAWNEPKISLSTHNIGLASSGFAPIGFSYPSKNTSRQIILDYNQDGLKDILDEKGVLFRNLGDDTFLEVPFYGKVIPKDLNGDFITDFIATKEDSVIVLIYEGKGNYAKQNLITSMAVDDEIYCYDFDKDNDIDVLLPFSFDRNKTATFFVFFENDGKGNFIKHEKLFMEQWKILQCEDVNHDGYYDFLMDKVVEKNGEYEKAYQTFMLMGKAGFEFDVFDNGGKIGDYLFDFDNDGFYEGIALNYLGDTVFHLGGIAPNTAPDKPAKPEIYVDKATGKLHINWKTVSDAQSSSCDLTYALRVGTAADKGDILYAHANANGTRRNKQDGNMGGNLSYTLNVKNWKAGDYYISLQAVDPMHSGSEWSDYAMLNNDLLYADFELSEETIAPNDTLTVRFTGSHSDNYIYNWNFGTATVIENTDNQLVKLKFNSAGQHEISLTIENANGQTSELYKQSVFVNLLNFKIENYEYIAAADYDADGDIDLATTDGLYKNDGNANFSKLAAIFNLSFAPRYALWEDIDKDGDPDLLYSINDAADGQSGILINNGNDDFTETAKTFPAGFFQALKADIDRDGNIDYFNSNKFFINNGDYTFTEIIMSNNFYYYGHKNIIDLNNDNFVDAWVEISGLLTFYINRGDGTFSENAITLPENFNSNTPIYAIQDFNNDNLPDILVKKNDRAFHIFVNQGNNTYDYGKDIIFDFTLHNQCEYADFDNNGFTDIVIRSWTNTYGNEAKAYIVLLDKDLKIKSRIETNYHPFLRERGVKMVDLNGDNIADALHYVHDPHPNYYESLERLMLREGFTPNTAPTPPQDLIAYQTESGIVIKWQSGNDTETPPHKLQYNLSIKDVNSGEYLFSPAVSNSDNVPPLLTRHYIKGNSIVLNKQLIPVGEYEIRLQTIDAWNDNSPFSAPANLNVTLTPAFDIPEFACAGSDVNIEYTGNTGANTTFSWNFDGGTVVSGSDAGPYTLRWENGGLKNVIVEVTTDGVTETFMSGIRISQIYTANIVAADTMVAGIAETITLPAIPENSSDLSWTIPDGSVTHNDFEKTATIVFNSAGEKNIEINWNENGCAAGTIADTITVLTALPRAQIDVVSTDQSSGGNIIRWTISFDKHIENVLIFKEIAQLNNFVQIAELDASTVNEFIDSEANANQRANRYRIAVKDRWGHIGTPGHIHKTVHLAINKAINGWNLYWNNYQGMAVSAYNIYRGTSPDNMTLLEQLPASTFSYTDPAPPSGELYYSLEIVLQTGVSKGSVNSKSNYISTQQAYEPIYVTSVDLFSASGITTITEAGDSLTISADILPANASLKNLTWEITSGSEFATINQNGIVKPIEGQSGDVEVSAKSQDGSEVSGTITLTVSLVVETNEAPEITNISSNPVSPSETDAVNVSATITDNDGTVSTAVLNWGLSSDNLDHQITMQKGTGDVFTTSTVIPAQSSASTVFYQITATDDDNLSTITSIFNYEVNSPQELLKPPYAFGFENNSFGLISSVDRAGAQSWTTINFGTPAPSAKMSGYDGTASVANEDWLVLPGFDFSEVTNAVLQFDEAINYANNVSNMKVLISTDYSGTGNPHDAVWVTLNVNNRAAGDNFEFVTVSPIDLSNWYGKETVYIAFLYLSSNNNAATWEIDNISIDAAEVSNELPQISNISTNPSEPTENDAVNVNATVTDSDGTIESVILSWGLSSGNLSNQITMQNGSGDVFTTSSAIPEQSDASTVYYRITATDDDSEAVNSSVRTYSIITGISNNTLAEKVKLYPIPVSNKLTIEIEGNSEEIELEIIDETGKILFISKIIDKKIINTSNLSQGVYFIKLENGNMFGFKKIIKY